MCVYKISIPVSIYLYLSIERERNFYFKELAHVIVEAGKSKIFRIGQKLETQGRVDVVALILRQGLEAEFLPPWGTLCFFP